MRKIIGVLFLLAFAAYVKFGNTITDVDYKVKTVYGKLPSYYANKTITYRVPGVVRFAGTDLHRPQGYFTQAVSGMSTEMTSGIMDAAVYKKSGVHFTKLDAKKAKLMGLEPKFTFWEDKGKWVLLFALICILFAFFWR